MSATHLDIADALARVRRRHAAEVAAANARRFAFERALERQCGAGPGHIFTKTRTDPGSERIAHCTVCGLPRHLAPSVHVAAHQPKREVTA